MKFEMALVHLRKGKKIREKGWTQKNSYVVIEKVGNSERIYLKETSYVGAYMFNDHDILHGVWEIVE